MCRFCKIADKVSALDKDCNMEYHLKEYNVKRREAAPQMGAEKEAVEEFKPYIVICSVCMIIDIRNLQLK